VLDTAALIAGGESLFSLGGLVSRDGKHVPMLDAGEAVEFHIVPEVAQEVRDPRARARLELIEDAIVVRGPSPEGMEAVVRFAKATGDYSALSRVDLRVLALAWTVEMEMNGGMFLRQEPAEPVFQSGETISMQESIALADDKVRREKEALEKAIAETDGWVAVKPKVMPVPITQQAPWTDQAFSPAVVGQAAPAPTSVVADKKKRKRKKRPNRRLNKMTAAEREAAGLSVHDDNTVDGETDDNITQEEEPAIEETDGDKDGSSFFEVGPTDTVVDDDTLAATLAAIVVEDDAASDGDHVASDVDEHEYEEFEDEKDDFSDDGVGWINHKNLEATLGQASGGQDMSERELLRVGCVTTDFAMQNVLLQMGINVVSVDGRRTITRVRRYVLRCQSCTEVTRELERKFCGRCGNASMTRVSFSVDRDGVARIFLSSNFKPRLRGTKYSIPMPRGGRNSKDLILCEDQIDPVKARRLEKQYERRAVDVLDPNTSHSAGRKHDPFKPMIAGYGARNPNAARPTSKKRK
jgi:RNA-binding protein NOB1